MIVGIERRQRERHYHFAEILQPRARLGSNEQHSYGRGALESSLRQESMGVMRFVALRY